ncbi:MAG: hypothetical protein IKE25_14030 [Clostridia bacterium]|nr:hypothetical protein [Clostridia bacterium]
MRRITDALILILAVIAAIVATGLIAGYSMWAWIVAYWAALTCKNLIDYCATKRRENHGRDHQNDS